MPNRIIKESICYSEDIDKLSPEEEIFFYRLLVNCDDYGRLDARIPMLKARLYPLKDSMKASDIKRYLKRLCDIGMVQTYCIDGKEYLYLPKWSKHQQTRATKSKYPSPTDAESCNQMISDDINGNQEQADVTDTRNRYTIHDTRSIDDFFERMWHLYPKKDGKGSVSLTQKKKLFKDVGEEQFKRCIERYVRAKQGIDRQYLKNGSTFFNSGYVDYLDTEYNKAEDDDDRSGILPSGAIMI